MVEAYHQNIVYPNKHANREHTFTDDGHLIESESYIGARVEAIESGVFRADIPVRFRVDVDRLTQLKVCTNKRRLTNSARFLFAGRSGSDYGAHVDGRNGREPRGH